MSVPEEAQERVDFHHHRNLVGDIFQPSKSSNKSWTKKESGFGSNVLGGQIMTVRLLIIDVFLHFCIDNTKLDRERLMAEHPAETLGKRNLYSTSLSLSSAAGRIQNANRAVSSPRG